MGLSVCDDAKDTKWESLLRSHSWNGWPSFSWIAKFH